MKIIKVFVSCPGDVTEERGVVRQVVDELNLTLPEIMEVILKLISWEKDIYPGFFRLCWSSKKHHAVVVSCV